MRTRMQYPLDSSSKILDGRLHEVDIFSIVEYNINDELFYIATFYDKTSGDIKLCNFLKNIDGILCNVPLIEFNWARINQCLNGCPSRTLSKDEMEKLIPKLIGLADTVSIEDIANNSKIRARNVTIQYPYSQGNDHIDGNIHQIIPFNVVRCSVNGYDLFYMEYYDLNLGHRMISFLIRIDGRLFNLPLTSYSEDEIRKVVSKYGVALVDPVALFAGAGIPTESPAIGLAMPMSLEDIVKIKTITIGGEKVPIVEFSYYIPYNPENPMNIADKVFRSSFRLYRGSNVDFVFSKEKNGNVVENAIREAIRANIEKIEKRDSFFMNIEVELPDKSTVLLPAGEGKVIKAVYFPGIHKRKIFMTPCIKSEFEKPTRLCDSLSIREIKDTNYAVTDNYEAFEGGFGSRLPISFKGLPKGYIDRKTFYDPIKKDDKPKKEEIDYFANTDIAIIRDFYIMTMNKIYDLDGSLLFDSEYLEEYGNNLANELIDSLVDLGLSLKEAKVVMDKIKIDFVKQRNNK